MAHELDRKRIKELEGMKIEVVELPDDGDYVIIYVAGMRLYANNPSLFSDDSGDVPAEV
jgi:hypothetical protein